MRGEDLPAEPGEEVLLHLSDDPLHLALRPGPVWPAGPRPGAEEGRGIDPLGRVDRAAVGPGSGHERGVTVGQELRRRPAEVVDAADDPAQGRRPGLVGRKPEGDHPRAAEDGHEGEEVGGPVTERPGPDLGPVALGLDPGARLEAQGGLGRLGRPELDHPAAQAGVRAQIPVSLPQLAQEDGRPQVWAGRQAALEVGEGGGRRLGGPCPRPVPWRLGRGRVPLRRPPVEPELPCEGGDRPAMAVEHVQFHPGFLRLQVVPPVRGSELSSPSLTGGASRFSTQTKDPRVTPRASALFVLNSLRYSCPLTALHRRGRGR